MFEKTCAACKARETTIAILKEQLAHAQEVSRSERSEYKRSVDSILQKSGFAMLGQGLSSSEIPTPTTPTTENPINIFQDMGEPKP